MIEDLDRPAIYRRAAGLLEERGWCKQQYEDACGQLCIVGALNLAAGLPAWAGHDPDYPNPTSDALTDPLDKHLGLPVAQWNDEHCESHVDAIDLLLEMAVEVAK